MKKILIGGRQASSGGMTTPLPDCLAANLSHRFAGLLLTLWVGLDGMPGYNAERDQPDLIRKMEHVLNPEFYAGSIFVTCEIGWAQHVTLTLDLTRDGIRKVEVNWPGSAYTVESAVAAATLYLQVATLAQKLEKLGATIAPLPLK